MGRDFNAADDRSRAYFAVGLDIMGQQAGIPVPGHTHQDIPIMDPHSEDIEEREHEGEDNITRFGGYWLGHDGAGIWYARRWT